MRVSLYSVALAVAACNPDDGRQGSATASPTTVTTATTAAPATTGDATTSDASTAALTTTAAPTTSTTAAASTSTTTGESTSSESSAGTTTAVGTTTADTGDLSCPPPGEQDCAPGPGSGEGDTCVKAEPCFRKAVQDAIKQVIAAHPEWFMHDDMGDFVVEVELYMNTVVELVAATGLCAIRDPNAGDEIAVKFDNSYAESFDILTAAGYARYGDGIYTATCAPAWF